MKTKTLLKEGQTRLSEGQVRRYEHLIRNKMSAYIARECDCSTQTVRDTLSGREKATGDKALKVLEFAENMVLSGKR